MRTEEGNLPLTNTGTHTDQGLGVRGWGLGLRFGMLIAQWHDVEWFLFMAQPVTMGQLH